MWFSSFVVFEGCFTQTMMKAQDLMPCHKQKMVSRPEIKHHIRPTPWKKRNTTRETYCQPCFMIPKDSQSAGRKLRRAPSWGDDKVLKVCRVWGGWNKESSREEEMCAGKQVFTGVWMEVTLELWNGKSYTWRVKFHKACGRWVLGRWITATVMELGGGQLSARMVWAES